jgi:hypothetical protein
VEPTVLPTVHPTVLPTVLPLLRFFVLPNAGEIRLCRIRVSNPLGNPCAELTVQAFLAVNVAFNFHLSLPGLLHGLGEADNAHKLFLRPRASR